MFFLCLCVSCFVELSVRIKNFVEWISATIPVGTVALSCGFVIFGLYLSYIHHFLCINFSFSVSISPFFSFFQYITEQKIKSFPVFLFRLSSLKRRNSNPSSGNYQNDRLPFHTLFFNDCSYFSTNSLKTIMLNRSLFDCHLYLLCKSIRSIYIDIAGSFSYCGYLSVLIYLCHFRIAGSITECRHMALWQCLFLLIL